MDCRVYKNLDGTVAVIHPNPKVRLKGENDTDFIERICAKDAPKNGLDGLPFKDAIQADLPPRIDRDKWREKPDGNIHVDNTIITRNDRIKADIDALDAELAKPDNEVNQVKVARLQRKLDKYKSGEL